MYGGTKTPNSQNNVEKEEQSWRNHGPWVQTILKSYSTQNRMELVKKKIHIHQWNRKESSEINTHTYGQLIYKNIQWRKVSLQQVVLDSYMSKNEIRTKTIHKNKLKVDSRPKCKTRYCKTPRRKRVQHTL